MVSYLDRSGDVVLLAAFSGDGAIIAAVLTGIAAIITAWAAIVRAKSKGNEVCEEKLAELRSEAEAAQAELHRLKMKHPEVMDDEE